MRELDTVALIPSCPSEGGGAYCGKREPRVAESLLDNRGVRPLPGYPSVGSRHDQNRIQH